MLGSGAMTNSIEDVTRKAEVIMLVGSNPEEAHPVIGMQIRAAVERGCRLIVVDPRDIGLAAHADIHLKLRPGTNVAFANGIVNYLIQHELYDEDFVRERTEGFEILAATVRDYTPELVEDICGIDRRDLVAAAKMYAAADAAAIMYCLGVTEHSTGTSPNRNRPLMPPSIMAGKHSVALMPRARGSATPHAFSKRRTTSGSATFW